MDFLFLNSECKVTFAPPCKLVLRRWAPCSSSEKLSVNSEFVPEVQVLALDFRDERWFDPHKCSCWVLPCLHFILICQHAMDSFMQRNGNTDVNYPVHWNTSSSHWSIYSDTWAYLKSLCCGEYLDRMDSKWEETGINCIMKCSIVCSPSCIINSECGRVTLRRNTAKQKLPIPVSPIHHRSNIGP